MRGPRVLFASVPIIVAALIAAGLVGGSEHQDPRNTSDEYLDAVNGAACYAHHGEEGFRPYDHGFAERYTQLPIGEAVDIPVVIAFPDDSMPTPQENITDIRVTIDLEAAANVQIAKQLSGGVATTSQDTLQPGEPWEQTVNVRPHAVEGFVSVRVETDPLLAGPLAGGWTATIRGHALEGDDTYRSLQLAPLIAEYPPGDWPFIVEWDADVVAPPWLDLVSVQASTYVNRSVEGPRITFHAPPETTLSSGDDPLTIHVPVMINSSEPALLDFEVRGTVHWPHAPGDGAPADDGVFLRFLTMEVTGGDEAVQPQFIPATGSAAALAALTAIALFAARRRAARSAAQERKTH